MKYLLAVLVFLCSFSSYAQLQYIEADSVVMWDQGALNFRQVSLDLGTLMKSFVDRTILPEPTAQVLKAWSSREPVDTTQAMAVYQASEQLYTAAQLLQHTADARYARDIEYLVYFPLQSCVKRSAESVERYVAAQAFYNAMSMVVATQGNDLYVNFYPNSSLFVHTPDYDYQLDIVTLAPYDNRVKLRFTRVKPKTGAHFKVFLQLPEGEWTSKTLPIYRNGHDTPYVMQNGYAVLEGIWKNAFEIYFDLPKALYATP
jgi:hypothetical protein